MRRRKATRTKWAEKRAKRPYRLQVPVDGTTWERVCDLAEREDESVAVIVRRLVRYGLEIADQRAA